MQELSDRDPGTPGGWVMLFRARGVLEKGLIAPETVSGESGDVRKAFLKAQRCSLWTSWTHVFF